MAAKWVDALLTLQNTDTRIRDIESRLTLLPKELSALKDKRDAAVAEVNSTAQAAKKIELERKTVESEIEKLNAENTKLQQQSAMVKKNNEYQAMLGAVALNKKKIGDLEGKVLELLDQYEEAKVAYRKLKQTNEAIVNSVRAEFEETVAFAEEIKKELGTLKKERPAEVWGVDNDTMNRYNRLLNGKGNTPPLVKVENGICGSCHLRVTPQALNNMQKGAVTTCDNCMHLIYLDE